MTVISPPMTEDVRYHRIFSWDCVEPKIIRALLVGAYEQTGQLDQVAKARRASDAVLRGSAHRVLGRPMASRHMSWALDVLRDNWLPYMPKSHLLEMAKSIQRTLAPTQRTTLPQDKAGLVHFVRARNNTENLRNIMRATFHQLHKKETPVRSGSSSKTGTAKFAVELQGEDASPLHQPADHQRRAWEGLNRLAAAKLPDRRAGLMILPTGAGKTYSATEWLLNYMDRRPGTRVLWIADRRELVDQAGRAFQAQADGMAPEFRRRMRVIHSGGSAATTLADPHLDIACVTRPSLLSPQGKAALGAFLRHPVVVVVDEAHHATSPTFVALLSSVRKQNPKSLIMGLTATPWPSGPGKVAQLRKQFPQTVIDVRVRDLVHSGFLAKPVMHTIETNSVMRLEDAELKAAISNDIPVQALSRLNTEHRNNLLVNSWKARKSRWGKTLVFACSIEHADALHHLFTTSGVQSSVVHSRSLEEIGPTLDRFRRGAGARVLVSVGMLLEGVDVPQARTAFIARPTTSRIVMRQMIGRVLRGEAAGGEAEANIVDLRDRWLTDIDVLAPIEVMPQEQQSVEAVDLERNPASPPRLLPGILDELSLKPIAEDIVERIRRAYEELNRELPYKWAMTSTILIGYFELNDENIPIFQHTRQGWDSLCRYTLSASKVPVPSTAAEFFEDLPAPRPHRSDLLAVCEFVQSEGVLPALVPIRSVLSIPQVVQALANAGPMTEAERTAWLRNRYEGSLARTAYGTYRDFAEAVHAQQLGGDDRHSTGIDVECPRAPSGGHKGVEAPAPRPSRLIEPIRVDAVTRGRALLKGVGEDGYAAFLSSIGEVPVARWTCHPVESTFAYFTYHPRSKAPWWPLIRINRSLQLIKRQVPDELLTYLVWHELCHFMLWGRSHDAEFRRLEALWPDATRLDYELDTLHERVAIGNAKR